MKLCRLSVGTVPVLIKLFAVGKRNSMKVKESLSDCPRPGQPKSCVNEQTITSIKRDIKSCVNEQTITSTKRDIDEDPHISEPELSDTNGLS
ncbi:hypothetical protein ElyMa_004299600 [Elysia marginata]|uniref:Uncharacterized protein n=1 Tax=Elysia marginata TaxID=1093978 RepID=A0AAV4GYS7_9GAST|nr:hypothetical protein ElyMa_004299600 [Elysia marginata]